jgi:signal transduction histidine kinase
MTATVNDQVHESRILIETRDFLIMAEYWAMQYVNESEIVGRKKFERLADRIDARFKRIVRLPHSDEAELGAQARQLWEASKTEATEALALGPGSVETEEIYPLEDFHDPIAESIGIMTDLHDLSLANTLGVAESRTEAADRQLIVFIAAVISMLLILAIFALRLIRATVRPLSALEEAASRFGEDDLDHRIDIDRSDEFGRVGLAFNGMAEKLSQSRHDLVHAQKMEALGQLAGGVAHDFNNQLTVIQHYTSFVAEDLPPGSALREDLDEVQRAAARAANLSQRLLTFARKEVARPQAVDPTELLDSLKGMLSRTLSKEIEVRVESSAPDRAVEIDPAQLEHVLMNLALNARDAMPGGGTLSFQIDVADGEQGREHLRISVRDTGMGMTPEVCEKVFEPFFTTKPNGAGTGLGLATCKRIITEAGGRMNLTSEVGRGTSFDILLPTCIKLHGDDDRVLLDASARESRVLLVEDEEPIRKLVERLLRKNGHEVVTACDGDDGFRKFAQDPDSIDLVLTDVIMPGMSGKRLAESIREVRDDVPVIMMSGHLDQIQLTQSILERDRLGFIAKPFTAETFASEVDLRLGRVGRQ